MTAGIEVYNSNNVLQITSDYKNLQFVEKKTVTLTTVDSSGYFIAKNVEAGDYNTVIAMRAPDNKPVSLFFFPVFKTTGEQIITLCSSVSTTVTLYIFKFINIVAGNYFEVYNSSGELCFSDGAAFMRVVEHKYGSYTVAELNTMKYTTTQIYNITSTKTLAVVPSHILHIRDLNPYEVELSIEQYGQIFTFNTGSVNCVFTKSYELGELFDPITVDLSTNYSHLIVDVTNY